MADPFVDNGVPFGSIAITVNGTVYECEDFTAKRPTRKIEREDHIGKPNGFVLVPGFVTATTKAQLATADTPRLSVGDTFPTTLRGTETWVIGEVDDPLPQKGYWTQNFTAHLTTAAPA